MGRWPKPSHHAEHPRAGNEDHGNPPSVMSKTGAARRHAKSDWERFLVERRLLHVDDVTIAAIKGQIVPGPVSQGANAVSSTHQLDKV